MGLVPPGVASPPPPRHGWSFVTDRQLQVDENLFMTPETLSQSVSEFLATAHDAIVLEDGAATFDLRQAKYSVSGEYNKSPLSRQV